MTATRRPPVRLILLALLLLTALAPVQGLAQTQATCAPAATRLCLNGNRFAAEVSWTVPGLGSGPGHAVPLTADTGLFWFFSDSNLELTVKVLDGRAINRHFWVFHGGLSSVEYTLTLTDLQTGAQAVYHNPAGQLASGADVSAFNEEAPPAGSQASRAVTPRAVANAAAAPIPRGAEFPVNVAVAGDQFAPAVAVAPDGSFLVVWISGPIQPPFLANVLGRAYDAAGNPKGGEIRLNTTASNILGEPSVVANAAGRYMVVWDDDGDMTARARLLDSAGQPLSNEMTITSPTQIPPSPEVTADPAGGFLVAWRERSADFTSLSIHWRRFDEHGQPLGADASLEGAGFVPPPRVATSPLGGFLLVWSEGFSGTDFFFDSNVKAQRLDATGTPVGASFKINVSDAPALAVPAKLVIYPDGGFAVVWTIRQLIFDVGNIFARRFSAAGVATTGDFVEFSDAATAEALLPTAVALPSGDTWVLWYNDRLPQEPDGGVLSGVFDPSWNLRGPVFRVNTYTAGVQTQPAVAASPAGDLVTAWASGDDRGHGLGGVNSTQDGNGFGVFAQRFQATTCAGDPSQLCLGGRFSVGAQFTNPVSGASGTGQALPLTSDTGAFWFFGPDNVELVIKVLDGRAVNGHFWVFLGALSDVEYTITVTDTETHQTRVYHNPPHQLASRADTQAF
ncbi:MAG TPA: hypothetical protein VF173_36510 [Thermoanaerobaculia bacterium]|nr:hypothetical protein [Thermoanaerobaculia bacterium]